MNPKKNKFKDVPRQIRVKLLKTKDKKNLESSKTKITPYI